MNPFSQLIGQNQAVELLQQAVRQDRVAPAYLFAGCGGVGRKLAALGFATLLLCQDKSPENYPLIEKRVSTGNHPDLLWVEPTYLHQGKIITAKEAANQGIKRKAPPQIRIEQIRSVTKFLSRPPLEASRCVVVLEEAQTMAEGAANALLKTLEEPGKATLILIAPSNEALLPTLVSRCQVIPFSRLTLGNLKQVLIQAGYGEILSQDSILEIAQGSPGKAITAWQHLQAIPNDLLDRLVVIPDNPCDALKLAQEINQNLDTETQLWLIDYLQYQYWQSFLQGKICQPSLEIFEEARQGLISYGQPRLVWEVTWLKMLADN